MDYHHQHNHQMHHQQQQYFSSEAPPSANEKALMWSNTQYMSESGYSTQAPSISSIDAFLSNEQMDSTMHTLDNNSSSLQVPQPVVNTVAPLSAPQTAAAVSTVTTTTTTNQPEWNGQQQQDISEDSNAVANWINYQDNSEMALKAIPDLLKLLIDEDLVVVQQAAILLNQMARMEAPRMGLIQTTNAVQCLVDCLNTTADLETARSLVGALYGVSTQKPQGVQAIINSKALHSLIKMLSAPLETIVSYSITTLHNVLLDCGDKVKSTMRRMGAVHHMIPLLNQSQNAKFLAIVIDCLQLLAFGNQESKQIILELGGTHQLVNLLTNHTQYQKLILNATRLLKVLSVCSQNKTVLINCNAIQALSAHLTTHQSSDIVQNCLITLRNLSDSATRLNGLEQLVANLLQLLAVSNDLTASTLAAGILSNLTCNNENNKKAALRSNGVQILLKIVQTNLTTQKPQLVEPCLCALRHITNRHSDMLLAQEQMRLINGLSVITQLMCIQPRSWPCIKAVLGLVRNFCTNQLNSQQLRQNFIIEKLMQILYDAFTEIHLKTNNGSNANIVVKIEDVNLLDIVDMSSASLLLLAKEYQNQIIMRDLDCIGFFVQMFYSPIVNIQKAAVSLLAELAANKECADVIEQQPGLQQFVQANFCNQFGVLKTISELSGNGQSNTNASVVLQHVTTLMQRLQEHKAAFIQHQQQQMRVNYQQQQQQEQFGQQQQPMYYNNPTQVPGFPPPQHPSVQQPPTIQQQQQFTNNPQFY